MSTSSYDRDTSLAALLAKYDSTLNLYDDLAKDISQMKKATQLIRQKTLKLLEMKLLLSLRYVIDSDTAALVMLVILAAGVKAQQRRKSTGARKLRRRESTSSNHHKSPVKSSIKLRASTADSKVVPGPAVSLKVHFELPAPPVRHIMSTRRSAKKVF
ncbi:hypothetical protein C0991_009520 [Blastosporella zonata]|nr:hypothetical protein C0991_009520 [Blastosporella zonata]